MGPMGSVSLAGAAAMSLLSGKADHQVILEAFAEFERLTCVKFISYQGQRDFVSIVPMSG